MIADIVYFSSLVLSISLASYYKKIDDVDMKRNFGAGLGLLIACLICGFQIFHTVLMMWGNILIIKNCNKSYIHQFSMAYTWIYLMYLHYNNTSYYVMKVHQVLALRLVGLAFELHNIDKNKKNPKVAGDNDVLNIMPSTTQIVAYTYFFIGIHKGPYYRWKIFHDHFNTPFGTLDDYRVMTLEKLKKAGVFAVLYLLLWFKYSPDEYNNRCRHRSLSFVCGRWLQGMLFARSPVRWSLTVELLPQTSTQLYLVVSFVFGVYYDDKFYEHFGTDFRFLYNISQLLMYFLQWQILMLLCTAVCTEAGFGVYPAKYKAIPGYGPSEQLSLEKLTADTPDLALQEYNFSMLKCFDNEKLLIGPKMKDTLRSWNMPTRYWFWANVYKNLTKCNKEVKSACSFFAWTVWIGPSLQQIILSSTLWVYVHLEAEYNELYNTSEEIKLPWDIGFSIMRIFCLVYLTPCLVIADVNVFLRYYNSIYWMFHVLMLGLIVGSLVLQKTGLFNYTYNIEN